MNLRTFSRRAVVLGDTVATNSDRLTRKVALKVDSTVVLATPADTGRARSNWIVDLDNEPKNTFGEPASPAQGAQQALDQGSATIGQYKAGQVIHITNNLDYIGKLNEGHSAQAPANFIEEAVYVGVQAVKGASLLTDVKKSEDSQ